MALRFERGLKLTVMTVVGGAGVGAAVTGYSELSEAASALCIVAGFAALGWMSVRGIREGGVRGGGLERLPRADRSSIRRLRRHPDEVPAHLTSIAKQFAQKRANNNDRYGWLVAALLLFNAQAHSSPQVSVDFFRIVFLVLIVSLGFASDYLGVLWRRAEETMKERTN